MEIMLQAQLCAELLLAFILGFFIGFEREKTGVPAGVRTFSAISIGACLFAMVSIYAIGYHDSTRIAAQVATGIGFLGAGVIFKHGDIVRGLTTAAVMWATAAIGMSVAYELYILAVFTTALIVLILRLSRFKAWKLLVKSKPRTAQKHEF